MKHVYLINNHSPAAAYGIGTYLQQIMSCIQCMQDTKLTVIELNVTGNTELERNLRREIIVTETDGIRTIQFPSIRFEKQEKYVCRYYRNIFYLLTRYISFSEHNIFHFNYFHDYPFFALLKEKYPNSVILFTVHYFNWCFSLKGDITRFYRLKDKTLQEEQKPLLGADKIICLSKYAKDLLISDYGILNSKIKLIPNALADQGIMLSEHEREHKKQILKITSQEKILLFVGRLNNDKGLTHLINAFRLILSDMSNVRLLIVGNGNYNTFFSECVDIWSKITFTGKLEREKLFELYQIADIGVIPSFHEQCSFAAIEMMMHGVPIVGTNAIGLDEMIEEGITGYKVKLDNGELSVRELSNCLMSALKLETPKLHQMRESSRKMFEQRYALSNIQEAMSSCYSNDI